MKHIQFVHVNELKTIEEYASSLLVALASLKTLEAYEIAAFKKGILDSDEYEASKTICWEIQRLLSLYQNQIKSVLERSSTNEDEIIKSLQKQMPSLEIPKKRAQKKKDA